MAQQIWLKTLERSEGGDSVQGSGTGELCVIGESSGLTLQQQYLSAYKDCKVTRNKCRGLLLWFFKLYFQF